MDLIRLVQTAIQFYAGRNTFWYLLIPCIIYLALFILGGFGLYRMASRRKIKYKWRAFVPFTNTYLLGDIAGRNCTFFGAKLKRIKLWLTITEVIAVIVGGFVLFCYIFLYTSYFEDVRSIAESRYGYYYYEWAVDKMTVTQKVFYYGSFSCYGKIYYLFELLYYLFFVTAIINVFRRYAPAQSTMFALLSVLFPIENIFIFAVSGNKEVDYNAYVKARYARYRNRYNNPPPYGGYGGYGGYYGGGSGYNYDPYTGKPVNHNGNSSNNSSGNSSEGTDGGDPFPEFNGNKNGGSSSGSSDSSSDSSNPFDI